MSGTAPKGTPVAQSRPPQRRLLRVQEAIARLACGKTTFYEYVKQGRLPIVKLGASTRVSEEALDQFIADLQRGVQPPRERS